jgi:membrane protein
LGEFPDLCDAAIDEAKRRRRRSSGNVGADFVSAARQASIRRRDPDSPAEADRRDRQLRAGTNHLLGSSVLQRACCRARGSTMSSLSNHGYVSHDVSDIEQNPRRGRSASSPSSSDNVRSQTLWRIAVNVVLRIGRDNLTLVAAGVAFYAMTAIFPAIAAFVSIYGLFADPHAVHSQIAAYANLLPDNALKLLTDALDSFSAKSGSALNVALLISLSIALWSAKAGVSSLMTGLNIANETIEKRNLLLQQGIALALTLGAILFSMVAFAAIALLPAVIAVFPLEDGIKTILGLGRWPLLAVLVCFGLAVVYRFGPYRERAKWRWITWGAAIATVLWLTGSALFSFYVSRFGSYDATYGSLAAPVILLLWFWLSALIVLLGAEIDAELEHGDGAVARAAPSGAP